MKKIDPLINLAIWIFFTLVFLAGCSLLFPSCKVLKAKQEKLQQTVVTDTTDSGHVSKSNTSSIEENEWWRAIVQYQQPKGRDTTINNFYSTPPTQPQVIYLEGGKGKKETQENKYDSTWDKRFERLEQIVSESKKEKKTEVLSTWQIIAICIGASVILSKIKFSWK